MSALRTTYKVLRSFLFTVITIAVAIYVVLYVVLSVPAVQKGRYPLFWVRKLRSEI